MFTVDSLLYYLLMSVAMPSAIVFADNDPPPMADILTPKGEVAIDFETGKLLPEEMDDGELEGGDKHIEWNYGNQKTWGHEYPHCKGLKLRQSPIDIQTNKVISQPTFGIEFKDYDQEVKFQLKNTHHSLSMTPIPALSKPTVKLSWLPENNEFELQEIHFHWGDGVNKGSEHEINDKKAAAEMHMVHYGKGVHKSDIGNIDNSVLVVGVMIGADIEEHENLDSFVRQAYKVNGTDEEVMCDESKHLINLLPNNHKGFYTYNGSLTTPPCYEVATWIIMSEPVYLSQERLVELSNFRSLIPKVGMQKISSNYRDIQPLLDRSVYSSFNIVETSSPLVNITKRSRFTAALKDYWHKIESIQGPARAAYRVIDSARKKLVARIRARKEKDAQIRPIAMERV